MVVPNPWGQVATRYSPRIQENHYRNRDCQACGDFRELIGRDEFRLRSFGNHPSDLVFGLPAGEKSELGSLEG